MATKDLLDRLANLPEREANTPTVPPIEVVAFVVRWNRGLRQWKTTTLAEFARVSVSTVERVERGERVSADALDQIAQAFGYDPGYFTALRVPLPRDEAAASMVEQFSNLEVVAVAAMKTHRAVREAARCHAYLIHRPGVPAAYDADIEALQEWLDLAVTRRSTMICRRLTAPGSAVLGVIEMTATFQSGIPSCGAAITPDNTVSPRRSSSDTLPRIRSYSSLRPLSSGPRYTMSERTAK
jgi:transcriptional regulator with XRE-family HTH domain